MGTPFRFAAEAKRDGESVPGPVGESDDHLTEIPVYLISRERS
jgi:hypothetical protein